MLSKLHIISRFLVISTKRDSQPQKGFRHCSRISEWSNGINEEIMQITQEGKANVIFAYERMKERDMVAGISLSVSAVLSVCYF